MKDILNPCSYCLHKNVCTFKDESEDMMRLVKSISDKLTDRWSVDLICKYYLNWDDKSKKLLSSD